MLETLRDIMSEDVLTIDSDDTAERAASEMLLHKVGALVVMSGKEPIGIVTERCFLKLWLDKKSGKQKVWEIMSAPLFTVQPDCAPAEAMALLESKGIKRLPVVEGGNLKGLITQRDLLNQSRESLIRMVTRQKELENEVDRDPLTCIYNKRYFLKRIEEESERANRYNSYSSLIFLDVDHFKDINDKYSHQAGDEVLKRLADLLVSNTRKSDVTARYGGEEFVVLTPSLRAKEALQLAEKLRKKVAEEKFSYRNERIQVTLSAGVAPLTGSHQYQDVIDRADRAMYSAKQNGRNQVRLFVEDGPSLSMQNSGS